LEVLPDLEKTSRELDIPMIRGIEAKPKQTTKKKTSKGKKRRK
jgi:hypothetical protein